MGHRLAILAFLCAALFAGAVPPAQALDAEGRIRAAERTIRNSHTEVGILFYEDGTELTRWEGSCCWTAIDFDEYWRLWNRAWAKVVFTHNHPKGTPWYFSKADVDFGILYRVKEMRVVGWKGDVPWLCRFERANFEKYPAYEYFSQWDVFFARVGMAYRCERVD